jgi:hypothetical protein
MHRITRLSSYAVAAVCLRAVGLGEWPARRFPGRIGRVGLRVLQDQGTTRLPGQASWPHAMRCVPHDQQRAVTPGPALTREHHLERRAVAPELPVDPESGRARLRGQSSDQTSARRGGWWRSPSRWRPAIPLERRPLLADIESICAWGEAEVAAGNGLVS